MRDLPCLLRGGIISTVLAALIVFQTANATPPLCSKTIADHFIDAKLVVTGRLVSAQRTEPLDADHALVAVYELTRIQKDSDDDRSSPTVGERVTVVDFCSDRGTRRSGHEPHRPQTDCATMPLWLPGVDAETGEALAAQKDLQYPLFLLEDYRPGAPQITWKTTRSVPPLGGACGTAIDDLPEMDASFLIRWAIYSRP